MKQVLVCTGCDAVITAPVEIYDSYVERPHPKKKSIFRLKKRLPRLGANQVWVNLQDTMSSICDIGICIKSEAPIGLYCKHLKFTPQYWMNVNDLGERVDFSDEVDDEHWCCGPSGENGPNTKCDCGAYVGTQCLECRTSNVFIPDNEKTKWKNV